MSGQYVFRRPMETMRELASSLTVRHCIVSGSGSDSACSAYIFSSLVPQMFQSVTALDFRRVDRLISAVVPYFCDSRGTRWTWPVLTSTCNAQDILPSAIRTPFPVEWLEQRFDMIAHLNIAAGGVMTTDIDGHAVSRRGFEDALASAIAGADSGIGRKASRCLIFNHIGSDYYVSAAPLTTYGSALSPGGAPVWGGPQVFFRMSAYRAGHGTFYGGDVVVNGGTMTIAEGINVLDAGRDGTYRFEPPHYSCGEDFEEAGMEEFWGDSAPALLVYD